MPSMANLSEVDPCSYLLFELEKKPRMNMNAKAAFKANLKSKEKNMEKKRKGLGFKTNISFTRSTLEVLNGLQSKSWKQLSASIMLPETASSLVILKSES